MTSPPIPSFEPNRSLPPRVTAGDALNWVLDTALPVGSSVFYVLTGLVQNPNAAPTPTRILIGGTGGTPAAPVAIASDGSATFDIPSTATAAWLPGRYRWELFALDASSNRTFLARGELRILPDPNGATPVDTRSRNQRLLANVQCLLEKKALDDVTMYKIGTRELTRMPVEELLKWEGVLINRVRNERIARGEVVPSRTIGIRFGAR